MFANPWWSVLILAGLVLCYLFIRYKHGGPLLENNADVADFWSRWWARFVAFRSWVITALGALFIAIPDLAVAVLPLDLSWLIGPYFAPKLTGFLTAYLAINTFFKTKPDGQKAD